MDINIDRGDSSILPGESSYANNHININHYHSKIEDTLQLKASLGRLQIATALESLIDLGASTDTQQLTRSNRPR
jgi:hypothetical protein